MDPNPTDYELAEEARRERDAIERERDELRAELATVRESLRVSETARAARCFEVAELRAANERLRRVAEQTLSAIESDQPPHGSSGYANKPTRESLRKAIEALNDTTPPGCPQGRES